MRNVSGAGKIINPPAIPEYCGSEYSSRARNTRLESVTKPVFEGRIVASHGIGKLKGFGNGTSLVEVVSAYHRCARKAHSGRIAGTTIKFLDVKYHWAGMDSL
jgi:hypothetical protein